LERNAKEIIYLKMIKFGNFELIIGMRNPTTRNYGKFLSFFYQSEKIAVLPLNF